MADDNKNDFGSILNGVLNSAAQIGGSYLNSKNQPKPAPAPAAAKSNWLPWAIGGGVLLVVVVVFFGMSRKG